MARHVNQVWEVRTTGSDTNGGAFKAGASGTDYSQQDAAQVSVTDGVTAGTATITSATANFTSAVVGNNVYVSGGTGSVVADRYEITGFTNSTTITVDRSTGLTAGTGVTLIVGGAIASLGELANATRGMVASNKAWVKGGTYTITSTVTFAQTVSGSLPAYNVPPTQVLGYASTRGDIGLTTANQSSRPTVSVNAALGGNALAFTGPGFRVRNLIVSLASGSFTNGISCSNAHIDVRNCKVSGHSTTGIIFSSNNGVAWGCEVTAGQTGSVGISVAGSSNCEVNYVHDTDGVGIAFSSSGNCSFNLVDTLSGASSDGIQFNGATGGHILYNAVYNAGRHGINMTTPTWVARVLGNILSTCGGYGLTNTSGAGLPAMPETDGNAFYGNASGTRNNVDDAGSAQPVNASGIYANAYDVTCSADPFTNAAGGDFSLNSTAGGGAAVKASAVLGRWAGLATIGYRDLGAVQHADPVATTYVFNLDV